MLTNFRTKQKQKKFSQHTILTQTTCVRKYERNKKSSFRILFFVMFENVVLCVDALMFDGVFDSTIYFSVLVLFLLVKEKWNDGKRFKNYGLHKLQKT
jgi:hypothetical protein